MNPPPQPTPYSLKLSSHFDDIFRHAAQHDKQLFKKLQSQIEKIVREPMLGKPLRNVLRNRRRVHINPFVLVYEIKDTTILILDFDHHDKIYKKY